MIEEKLQHLRKVKQEANNQYETLYKPVKEITETPMEYQDRVHNWQKKASDALFLANKAELEYETYRCDEIYDYTLRNHFKDMFNIHDKEKNNE
tara:strand:+ start:940 stop:1221 length:282 start_codon:yes stop_codon:yes gene_type:complete